VKHIFDFLVRRKAATIALVLIACLSLPSRGASGDTTDASTVLSTFDVKLKQGAVVSLRRRNDKFDTPYIMEGRRLGDLLIAYRTGDGDWTPIDTADLLHKNATKYTTSDEGTKHQVTYRIADGKSALLEATVEFQIEADAIDWSFAIINVSSKQIEIGDLAVPLPMNNRFRENRPLNSTVLKHSFISGHGSHLFWMRPNSVGPYLTMTPKENTSLEFWEAPIRGRRRDTSRRFRGYRVYIHSAAAGELATAKGCKWRQPHTSLKLAPAGKKGDSRTYGFRLHWAEDYEAVRQLLVDQRLIDAHVVPGMTVPTGLSARIAMRTKETIHAVEAEFPQDTAIESLGSRGDYDLYEVRFAKLGENRLKVRFGDRRHTYLEFFCTEPLETMIKKRAAFLARSQHRDASKWYNGLITDWNMESSVLLSPDNYDRIRERQIYAVTCDDPGLGKPAFLAAKNAEHPVSKEIEALDYYIENFVWGGLQMTTEEKHPYAIYGIQDWKRNRESDDPGRNGRLHIWRVYDYPHIVLMYFSMYRVAKNYPHLETKLSAEEYLRRAYGTAHAMFTVPLEVEGWSAYQTGFYNELVIKDLIDALESNGMRDQAERLRRFWQRKVRYFVNDKPSLFVSEYSFDSTGFESTHALARYAVEHARPASGRDIGVKPADARRFMEEQMAANLFCRGWLQPAYYYLGSDYRYYAGNTYTLSYMSQMGGWSVLDYALHFAEDPSPYLRLGYASYLSSWALLNSGTPESNYGYWYPGKENDGAAGGGFEPAPHGVTWLGQPHHRGSWYYACEIDLGYCGALRAAATVLTDDPIFGRTCLGGLWNKTPSGIAVTPKDGLRRRFHAILDTGKLHLVLDNDRFAAGRPITIEEDLSKVQFHLESDNPAAHTARLSLSGLPPGNYKITHDGRPITVLRISKGHTSTAELPIPTGGRTTVFAIEK